MQVAARGSVSEQTQKALSKLARYLSPHDITAAMARRQRLARRLRENQVPEVGIFWFIQEAGGAPAIVASSVALPQGKAYGVYIDGREDHASFWGNMKQAFSPLFRDFGPKDWPRGRVLFNTAMKHFEVDLNRELISHQFTAEILSYFRLPKASTVFSLDPHYAETRFTFGPHGPQDHGRQAD